MKKHCRVMQKTSRVTNPDPAQRWRERYPDVKSIRAAMWDINGILRGKRLPASGLGKVLEGGMRMPLSIAGMDVWGADIENSPLVFAAGDVDGLCESTGRGPVPLPWTGNPTALVPVWLKEESGEPYLGDPRRVLDHVLSRYRARGWRPVVSTELEFFLVSRSGDSVRPAASPVSGVPMSNPATMAINHLDEFDAFIEEVFEYGSQQHLPLDTTISENGIGQFEINLTHTDDVLRAADDALLFKHLVRGVARKHGFEATFMAKPFADMPGSGLHVHFSLLDDTGTNLFDDGGPGGSDKFFGAIAGMQRTMVDNALVFAPHFNSYRRLQPKSYAPVKANWGYENRMAALRIPAGPSAARRIEHRVSGADANPYLVLSAILGAALDGIEDGARPSDPVDANGKGKQVSLLTPEWRTAIELFAESKGNVKVYPETFRRIFLSCKRQELAKFASYITPCEYAAYLDSV